MAEFDPERIKKPGREGLAEYFIMRHFSKHISKFIITKTKITANQVTAFSLFLAIISAAFFYLGDYRYLLIGTIVLFISQLIDSCDGEVARYYGIKSKFGQWWDESTDVIKITFIFFGVSLGLYRTMGSELPLILGTLAMMNMILFNYIRQLTKANVTVAPEAELNVGKKFFFGITVTTIFLVMIFAVINILYYLLWIYATLGFLLWLKKIHTGFKMRDKFAI